MKGITSKNIPLHHLLNGQIKHNKSEAPELADLLEVIRALSAEKNITMAQIQAKIIEKKEKKGI